MRLYLHAKWKNKEGGPKNYTHGTDLSKLDFFLSTLTAVVGGEEIIHTSDDWVFSVFVILGLSGNFSFFFSKCPD